MKLQLDLVDDERKVFNSFYKIQAVHINDEQSAFLVVRDPQVVMLIQIFQVVDADRILIWSSAFLYVCYEFRNVCLQINKQVRRINEADHGIEDIQVARIIAF